MRSPLQDPFTYENKPDNKRVVFYFQVFCLGAFLTNIIILVQVIVKIIIMLTEVNGQRVSTVWLVYGH